METSKFLLVKSELQRLLAEGVSDLAGISGDIRHDGLPQNWVDDIDNLQGDQRLELAAVIHITDPTWAQSLKFHLMGG